MLGRSPAFITRDFRSVRPPARASALGIKGWGLEHRRVCTVGRECEAAGREGATWAPWGQASVKGIPGVSGKVPLGSSGWEEARHRPSNLATAGTATFIGSPPLSLHTRTHSRLLTGTGRPTWTPSPAAWGCGWSTRGPPCSGTRACWPPTPRSCTGAGARRGSGGGGGAGGRTGRAAGRRVHGTGVRLPGSAWVSRARRRLAQVADAGSRYAALPNSSCFTTQVPLLPPPCHSSSPQVGCLADVPGPHLPGLAVAAGGGNAARRGVQVPARTQPPHPGAPAIPGGEEGKAGAARAGRPVAGAWWKGSTGLCMCSTRYVCGALFVSDGQ